MHSCTSTSSFLKYLECNYLFYNGQPINSSACIVFGEATIELVMFPGSCAWPETSLTKKHLVIQPLSMGHGMCRRIGHTIVRTYTMQKLKERVECRAHTYVTQGLPVEDMHQCIYLSKLAADTF